MRFKHRSRTSQLPNVDLVPMMDVLMTVLTFFIIISMTLRGQQIANVQLPQTDRAGAGETEANESTEPVTLVVGLNAQNEIVIDNQPINVEQMTQSMQTFLNENPNGVVLLKADRGLTYKDVSSLLKTMRDVGGSRVSLAFDRTE